MDEREFRYALMQFCISTIRTIAEQTPAGDRLEHEAFVREVQAILDATRQASRAEDLMSISTQLSEALAAHDASLVRFRKTQTQRVQELFAEMNAILESTGTLRDSTLQRLRNMQDQALRVSLTDSLMALERSLRNFVPQMRAEAGSTGPRPAQETKPEKEAPAPRLSAVFGSTFAKDRLTGLPSAQSAAETLLQVSEGMRGGWVLLFVLQHIRMVNTRYGDSVGDQMMLGFRDLLVGGLSDELQIFRWTGPAFVAIAGPDENPDTLQQTATRLCSTPLQRTIRAHSTVLTIPIARISRLFAIPERDGLQALFREMHGVIEKTLG